MEKAVIFLMKAEHPLGAPLGPMLKGICWCNNVIML